MGKKNPFVTPTSRIRNALRQLFLRSRERSSAVRAHNNTCIVCGRKGSVAKGREVKIQVHHIDGIGNWDKVIETIRQELLCSPDRFTCLCKECHSKEHSKENPSI